MELHLVAESVKFMILGMTIVFLFLYLLVWLMRLQAWLISRYFPQQDIPVKQRKFGGVISEEAEEERRRVAAIIAAVQEYRRKARTQKDLQHG